MVKKIKYEVIRKIDNFEIRKYPEFLLASVENYDDNKAFGFLFDYISGKNKIQEKIEMTAPVISSKKIEMTSPVLSNKNYFAFVMPSNYTKDNIPLPLNPKVKIKVQPQKQLAVTKFGGYASDKKVKKFGLQLLMKLKLNNIKTKGEPILMRYNSPFAPPFFRRNEIGVEIKND